MRRVYQKAIRRRDNMDDRTYPKLPKTNDPRWRQATVRPRRQRTSDLRTIPGEDLGSTVQTVYTGDVISIIRAVSYESWIAAKVGYRVGWLNSHDLDLALTKILNPAMLPEDLLKK